MGIVEKITETQAKLLSKYDKLNDDGSKKSQSTLLLELSSHFKLFHDANGAGYVILPQDGHDQIWPINSRDFKNYLSGLFYKTHDRGCNRTSLSDAVATLEAKAQFDFAKESTYLRVARLNDTIFIDLADDKWRVIQVTAKGWTILNKSPVKFIRKAGMTCLPTPSETGQISHLREFLNVDEDQYTLAVSWILGALRGLAPYPVLVLQGEQGTGKSTTSKIIRSLVDTSTIPLRSPPRELRDFVVSAVNNHVIALDNLSGLTSELSDALCRCSTGGGLDMRQLFTDTDQILLDITRPVIVNGIDDICTRPDLSERSIILNLPVIPEERRSDEKSFWAEFDAKKPAIFAGILEGLSAGLANEAKAKDQMTKKPRMADFAIWVNACHSGIGWEDDRFNKAYTKNLNDAVADGIEASPIGSALLSLLDRENGNWFGSPSELFMALEQVAAPTALKSRAWPGSPRGMRNSLMRLAPNFRRIGVTVTDGRNMNARFYRIERNPVAKDQPGNDVEVF